MKITPPRTKRFKLASLIALYFLLGILSANAFANPIESDDKRYLDNDDGTITDTQTGLMWMKTDSYLHTGHWFNWQESKEYVRQLNDEGFAHHSDWRLASIKELQALYDPEKVNSSQAGKEMKIHIDPIFEKNGCGSLWSSEANGRHNAWGVVFNTGSVFNSNKKSRSRKATRAVRNNTH